jgi:hypothetical protein
MAGSFERIAGAKEENTIFGSITRFWESPLRQLLVKEEAPQYLVSIREILNSDEIIIPTPNQVAGFLSHATDPDREPGEHWMYDEERYSMSSRGRGMESAATDEGEKRGIHVKRNGVGAGEVLTLSMVERGLESAATDEGEERGIHVKRNGVGAGEVLTMSMSERGSLGAEESAAADDREIAGLKYSNNLKRDRKSMSDRGLESAATDEGEKRGIHVKRNGVGAGEVLTMSMVDRGMESAATDEGEERGIHVKRKGVGAGVELTPSMSARRLGSQNTEEPIMLLELVSSTKVTVAEIVPQYTRNQADVAAVLLKNQFFKSIAGSSRTRIREWKAAAEYSNDNSHTFSTKPRSDNAPRATDVWKLSLFESLVSVLATAPNATEVNDDDRKASASNREKRKRK